MPSMMNVLTANWARAARRTENAPPGMAFDRSHAAPVELRLHALAVHLERAFFSDCVGTDKNPILPCRQTAEDSRLHRFVSAKTKIRLEPGERIGRHTCSFFERHPDFVRPVKIVGRGSHQAQLSRGLRRQGDANARACCFDGIGIPIEAMDKSRLAVDR